MGAVSPASMYLLTGFLGSGKTTVLNGLLRSLSGRRVGVIVNEWGKIGVDGRLLIDPTGLGVVELAGGQIFCSCVSGSFIAAAVRLAARGLDYLLVETSGLAKPSVLETIVREAERRSEGLLAYRGMVCVVDAARFPLIRKAAAVAEEQAVYSDRFVVTKTDIADSRAVAETRGVLAELSPLAPVSDAVNGAVDASLLGDFGRLPPPARDSRFSGWGSGGRPGSSSVVPSAPVSAEALNAFLSEIVSRTHRVKGFVLLRGEMEGEDRVVLVDCVGDRIAVREVESAATSARADEALGFTLVWKGASPENESIRRVWLRFAGTDACIA